MTDTSTPVVADEPAAPPPPDSAERFLADANAIIAEVQRVIEGKPDAVRTALTVLIAEGHLLIEDVPGVGKTALASALSRAIGGTVRRIQFTPDLLPSDVTGVSVFDQGTREFDFRPGAVFANLVIGDEINRASPKTQSALLEAMEEHQVTVDGVTHALPTPFTVVATQNPFDMEGTYALPEAQRDRFMARISMGYPDRAAELAMVRDRDSGNPMDRVEAVVDLDGVRALIAFARGVFVSDPVERYVVELVRATRTHPDLRLGASPRATLQLVRAAKARAALDGRDFVLPDDIDALVIPVLAHRVVPTRGAAGRGGTAAVEEILATIRAVIPVPVPR